MLGQFLGLFLREDCDLGASVLTLEKNPKTQTPKKPPKPKKHKLLFLRWSSSGIFHPSGCMGEELLGENSLIGMLMRAWFLQVLKIMFRYLKNPTVNEGGGGGWLMYHNSTGRMVQQEPPAVPKRQMHNPASRKEQPRFLPGGTRTVASRSWGSGCSPLPGTHKAVFKIPSSVLVLPPLTCRGNANKLES